MTAPALTVSPATTVAEARGLLRSQRIRHLPVLKDGLLCGILSDRDLRGASDGSVTVDRLMTRTVFVVAPDASLRDAARIFRQRRFGALPVGKGREVVGIVSIVDVMSALDEGDARSARPPRPPS